MVRKYFSTIIGSQCTMEKLSDELQGIALIEIDNPEKRNALSAQVMNDLREIIQVSREDSSIKCAIFRSATPGIFCAGADLKARLALTNDQTEDLVMGLRNTFNDFANLPFPTIASIDGAALGGGLEIALACDLRIASKNSLIGLPETALAIIPGAGGTQRLPRLISPAKAKELIFTGARLKPQEALEIGILNYVEEDYEASYNKALSLAKMILRNGPLGVRAAKNAINKGLEVDLQTGLEIERLNYSRVAHSSDRIEGLKAFVEKRKPQYKGQ
ncbi:hypothetical protein PPERSA_06856 [Pseudocohnilembus persalinus]|uniref:ClpP/crotonase-like domain n=1 Tax=Pseudocohnilembus persalinus TaxID=266149 RepID=A0A0V0QSI6_PSEPJ|nr:hypothetical protein PPERSA_06856 [Pseudocohnilembus persalinus]|eukprot:KRX05222.1 hypothetical protein PPERSA_06856 [Pseudocohnilembus persalinus]